MKARWANLRIIGLIDSDTGINLKFNFPFRQSWAKLQHEREMLYTFYKKVFSVLARVSADFLLLTKSKCHFFVTLKLER